MGRNAAFGRPPAQNRLRQGLQATSRTARINALLAVGVIAIVILLMTIATSRDPSRSLPLANATRPNLTPGVAVSATSTSLVGSLFTAGAPVDDPVDRLGLSPTTTTSIAVAPTVPAPSTRVAAAPSTPAGRAPAPATTVPTGDVIFTAVPTTTLTTGAPTTSTPTTAPPAAAPPVTATVPPVTPTPTTAPPATTPPTTAPGLPLPLALPPLLGPR